MATPRARIPPAWVMRRPMIRRTPQAGHLAVPWDSGRWQTGQLKTLASVSPIAASNASAPVTPRVRLPRSRLMVIVRQVSFECGPDAPGPMVPVVDASTFGGDRPLAASSETESHLC